MVVRRATVIAILACFLCVPVQPAIPDPGFSDRPGSPSDTTFRPLILISGSMHIDLDEAVLSKRKWSFTTQIEDENTSKPEPNAGRLVLPIEAGSTLEISDSAVSSITIRDGLMQSLGTVFWRAPDRTLPISNLALVGGSNGTWNVFSKLADRLGDAATFDVADVEAFFDERARLIRVEGTLLVSAWAAAKLGTETVAGTAIGTIRVDAVATEGVGFAKAEPSGDSSPDGSRALSGIGPDVIVGDISGVIFWGSTEEGIGAFSVGTISCNLGDEWLDWIWNTNRHPVIAQAMYRLKDGRFEQIGMSWLKHGFFAIAGTLCSGPGQCNPDPHGEHLGVGCSDPYSAGLNGQQSNLGPRSDLNAYTGRFPVPWSAPPPVQTIGRRLQVREEDYDPNLNAGALYFAEGHYLTRDDAVAKNQDNNASYRGLSIAGQPDTPALQLIGSTQRTKPAIRAWRDTEPDVVETEIPIMFDGLFFLAAKATDLGTGFWHYEYALHNLNADRSGQAFSVPIDPDVILENVGFHDVDHHSGEPYDPTDWLATRDDSTVSWAGDQHDTNRDANAIRFGTLYNFRFDADVGPEPTLATLSLFKPGSPSQVVARTVGPAQASSDCNDNGLNDLCDLDCDSPGTLCDHPGCGESQDLDGNLVPDDCQPDCNGNMVPDTLDVSEGTSPDCNTNLIPDECEPDSDSDALIDDCDPCPADPTNDADGDGTCAPEDQCPGDPLKVDPGTCGCGQPENDSDGDGALDCVDGCPNDPEKVEQGVCGCGEPEADIDGDGVPDCTDGCPNDPEKLVPGVCGCGISDADADGDGMADCVDLCPGLDDGVDVDANGTPDCVENIPVASTWGLIIFGLLLAVAAKTRFRRYPLIADTDRNVS